MSSLRKLVIFFFISVPILSSFISTFHLFTFFSLGNINWMSAVLAFTFEVGSIASFLSLAILGRINKNIVWWIFGLLFFMQIVGNVYYSFDYINLQLAKDPNYLKSFNELISIFYDFEIATTKFLLSFVMGVPIVLVSVFLLKSLVSYLEEGTVSESKKSDTFLSQETLNNAQSIKNIEIPLIEEEKSKEQSIADILFPANSEETPKEIIEGVAKNATTEYAKPKVQKTMPLVADNIVKKKQIKKNNSNKSKKTNTDWLNKLPQIPNIEPKKEEKLQKDPEIGNKEDVELVQSLPIEENNDTLTTNIVSESEPISNAEVEIVQSSPIQENNNTTTTNIIEENEPITNIVIPTNLQLEPEEIKISTFSTSPIEEPLIISVPDTIELKQEEQKEEEKENIFLPFVSTEKKNSSH